LFSSKTDSIDYLSSSWANIFKTGNDTDKDSLNLFRQFHCADCLKAFHQQQQADKKNNNSSIKTTNTGQPGIQLLTFKSNRTVT
jgi:hypothetical protein